MTALNADYITSKLPPFTLLDEPELTFKPGNALADVSPLRGLDRHGPYSSASFPLYIPQLRLATLGPANGLQRVGDLVKAALIQSANDAAVALAEYVGHGNREAFVSMMNEKAQELGLDRTHFIRPDGLDVSGHYSTAQDVTKLAQFAMRNPRIRSTVRTQDDSIPGGRHLHTWNDLLGVFKGLYGVKTGHTGTAGWCEVAAVRRNGVTLYTTVLGSPTRSQRNQDLAALLRWGISRYRPVRLVPPGRVYLQASVGYGKGLIPIVAARQVARAVRIDRPLVARIVAPPVVSLPVARGQVLGELRTDISADDLARMLQQTVWGTLLVWCLGPESDVEARLRQGFEVYWRGVKKSP